MRNPFQLLRWILRVALCLTALNAPANELVLVWNDLTLRAIRYANIPPPVAVRQMAIVHLAMHDAANGIDRRYKTYALHAAAPVDCSLDASVSTAAYVSLRTLFPKSASEFDSHHRALLSVIPDTAAKRNGVAWGERSALEILKQRQFDGAGQSTAWVTNHHAGYWQRSLPNYDQPLLPNWGKMKPFVIPSAEEFRPPPPPALTSSEWARQYHQVKVLGETNSTKRTPAQREIALFWADGFNTETPPGHWNKIAQQVVQKKGYDLIETARLFALLNVALADASVVCWDAKYTYNYWRPITAIHNGDRDGNSATVPDLDWRPLLNTPPFPEHTSGHSTFSGAGATVLSELTGSDEFQFITTSDGLPGVVRRFRRFSDAAREAGMSRIYGGIHFAAANDNGLECGKKIADYVLEHSLRKAERSQ